MPDAYGGYHFFDANGVEWIWDGYRVFVLMTSLERQEEEMSEEYYNSGHGYNADNLEEALDILKDYGYMDREE